MTSQGTTPEWFSDGSLPFDVNWEVFLGSATIKRRGNQLHGEEGGAEMEWPFREAPIWAAVAESLSFLVFQSFPC